MKKGIKILCFLFLFLWIPFVKAEEKIDLYLFYGDGCPHCASEKEFLSTLETKYEELEIHLYEVWYDEENQSLLDTVKDAFQVTEGGVPFTVIGKNYFIGYNENIGYQIENVLKNRENLDENVVQNILNDPNHYQTAPPQEEIPTETPTETPSKEKEDLVKVPILGEINPKTVSLPLLGAIIGFVDGFNPCAMWILLLLISMLLGMKNRKRMWILGFTFLGTSALVYLLFMVSWLQVAMKIQQIMIVRNIIALVALLAGGINLIKFYKEKKNGEGCDLVDKKKRKKMIQKIKKFTTEKSFFLAMIGIITLAVSVNLVELACSAGLPLLYTQVLAMNDLSTASYAFNIFLYILFFLLDDVIVFTIAMTSLKMTGFSKKYGNLSHLIGGIIMVILGLLLLFKPELIMFNF